MICQKCATAAEYNAIRVKNGQRPVPHPNNCGCPCQHKPVGSWKGTKS